MARVGRLKECSLSPDINEHIINYETIFHSINIFKNKDVFLGDMNLEIIMTREL